MRKSVNQSFHNNDKLEKVLPSLREMAIYHNNTNTSLKLPIDMQFNSGHVVSISVYSVLFVLSALGMHTYILFHKFIVSNILLEKFMW